MKWAPLIMAAALLLPAPVTADEASRQLHYVGTTQIGGQSNPMTIDVDVSSLGRYSMSRVDVDEHIGNEDLGPLAVMLGRSGVVEDAATQPLTFEEETIVDMLALQFEDLGGVDPGDNWDRVGELHFATNHTHYLVRRAVDGIMDFDVARTIDFSNGAHGSWRGSMRYNATSVVPTAISIAGELIDDAGAERTLRMSARLAGDSFQP